LITPGRKPSVSNARLIQMVCESAVKQDNFFQQLNSTLDIVGK